MRKPPLTRRTKICPVAPVATPVTAEAWNTELVAAVLLKETPLMA
jgi:hypothetical protein